MAVQVASAATLLMLLRLSVILLSQFQGTGMLLLVIVKIRKDVFQFMAVFAAVVFSFSGAVVALKPSRVCSDDGTNAAATIPIGATLGPMEAPVSWLKLFASYAVNGEVPREIVPKSRRDYRAEIAPRRASRLCETASRDRAHPALLRGTLSASTS